MILHDIDDDELITAVQRDFDRARYIRPVDNVRFRRPHTAVWIGTAVAATLVATTLIVAASPAETPAFGWSPEARPPTEQENQTALALCDATRVQSGNSTGVTPNTTGVANMTLDALDLRGDFAVATLHTPAFTKLCFITTAGDEWTSESWLVLDAEGPDELKVNGVTAMIEGRTVIFGWTSLETILVQLQVPNLPSTDVEVHEHMFATWVPMTLEAGSGSVQAFDASGALVDEAPVELWPTEAPTPP